MAEWRALGRNLNVSVNVSGRQLDRDAIIDHVTEALTLSGLEPAALTIEITETALLRNVEATSRRLRELNLPVTRVRCPDPDPDSSRRAASAWTGQVSMSVARPGRRPT
jgi:predicted signal transduction protein with EAL and GGDEF domain